MRNLIIGDVHGHFDNLRKMLLEHGAINEKNERINRDTLSVYSTGDLVDGGVNRMGDLLILQYAREWFDAIVIGNHELPFFGGVSFLGLRKHDRELTRQLLQLEHEGVYVPSAVVEDFLLVHAGLSDRWSFKTAQDANDVIHTFWNQSEDDNKEIPMLDWVGPGRSKVADPVGGIFWLDWTENRNRNINQVVGHSTYTHGPIIQSNGAEGTEHWNIDVGGKYGTALGGIMVEAGQPTLPVFWGSRSVVNSYHWHQGGSGIDVLDDDVYWDKVDDILEAEEADWDDVVDLDDPENYSMWQELMETNGI